jgi:predicted transcriptional regulator
MAKANVQKIIRIPPLLAEKLEQKAREWKLSQTEIMIRALEKELDEPNWNEAPE